MASLAPESSAGAVAFEPHGAARGGVAVGERFGQRKEALLEALSCGADKSKKGSFDAPIQDMLDHLNLHSDYVSTSSCSGRVAVFWEATSAPACPAGTTTNLAALAAPWPPPEDGEGEAGEVGEERRGGAKRSKGGTWLLCKHAAVTVQEVSEALARAPSTPGVAFFKHEPFILHVQCRDLEAARKLMEVARAAGFRESGISLGKRHVIVGVRTSALKIDAPVLEDGKLIADESYFAVLVRLANDRFAKNQAKSDHLHSLLAKSLLASIPNPAAPHEAALQHPEAGLSGSEAGPQNWVIACEPAATEATRSALSAASFLDTARRNQKQGNGRIAVPVLPALPPLLRLDAGGGDVVEALRERLAQGFISLDQGAPAAAAGKGKGTVLGPAARLLIAARALLLDAAVGGGDGGVWSDGALQAAGVPKRWEELGDMWVLPQGSFTGGGWEGVGEERLWAAVAEALGCARVAVKGEIDTAVMRESHLRIMYPPGAEGWVMVAQNGLKYTFDATKVMFSRGNVGERRRMGLVPVKGETVVDLFCGVGYFTIPLLATADVAFLHACELNPNSVEALRRNLDLNKVADRCKIHHGDNRVTSAALHGIADRVLLGLLPSSEYAWPIAVACLKEGGGVLHVHENVSEADQQAWVMRLEAEIRAAGARLGRRWTVSCGHVERVKTFAPRVWHLVADVSCSPA